jgi:hypothetical protein
MSFGHQGSPLQNTSWGLIVNFQMNIPTRQVPDTLAHRIQNAAEDADDFIHFVFGDGERRSEG